nr:hypothetical protein [Flavobacterium sp. ASV13]
MENVNNPSSENYCKCFHSSIYTAGNSDFIYTKAYQGDWGDWDDQPEIVIIETNVYDLSVNDTRTAEDSIL